MPHSEGYSCGRSMVCLVVKVTPAGSSYCAIEKVTVMERPPFILHCGVNPTRARKSVA